MVMGHWQTHGNPPEGLAVREIEMGGAPAFLFLLKQPVGEGEEFSLRFTWGALRPLGTTTLTFPVGVVAQVWALPEQLVEDRRWIDQLRELGGEEWVSQVSHPHYLPQQN